MYRFILVGSEGCGKNTLVTQLLLDLGKITAYQKENFLKRDHWVWNYISIRGEERCEDAYITLPLAFQDKKYEIVDTREPIQAVMRYQEQMTGVFVVSVIPLEFEQAFRRGKMKEHLVALRASGIQHLILVLNKMDAIEWKEPDVGLVYNFITKLKFEKWSVVKMSALEGVNKFLEHLTPLTEEPNLPQTEEVERDSIWIKATFLHITRTITLGYRCMCHIRDKVYPAEVDHIKNKIIVRKDDCVLIRLKLNHNVKVYPTQRVLLRDGDFTLGFGLVKVKISAQTST